MYTIELTDGTVIYMNERIIEKIVPNKDETFTLHHFNDSVLIIKSFSIYK